MQLSAARAAASSVGPREAQASGAFLHGEFVISVRGLRLKPDMSVQATYDLDPESQWPVGWPAGMDFLTSTDGRLWEVLHDGTFFPVNTGAVARLKDTGSGFSYSVPLSAMHEPAGPITFAISVASYYPSNYFVIALGRAECRQCPHEIAVRP